jgi:putative peptide zinc metalloprotease protein
MQFLWKQRWDIKKRLSYMGGAAIAGVAVLILIAFMPWRFSIRQPLVILSQQDESVFVSTPGYVEKVLHDTGEMVHAGDPILTLRDPSLQTLLDQATSERQVESVKARNAADKNQPAAIDAAQKAIAAYDEQIALIKQRINDLTLRAPVEGVIVQDTSLRRIVGNYVPAGLKICRVIRTDELEARISLPQQQAAMVKPGMPVRIRLWSNPGSAVYANVSRVSSTVSDQLLHPALASTSKGDVDVKAEANGDVKSTNRRSTVIIELPPGTTGFLADGMTGRGEIEVRRTTVVGRIWRAVLDSTTPDWHL